MSNDFRYHPQKFLVLNNKHIGALASSGYEGSVMVVNHLYEAIDRFYRHCEMAGLDVNRDNKYYVCNQDEPYAGAVLDVILSGEQKKRG